MVSRLPNQILNLSLNFNNHQACRGFCESYAVPSPPLATGLIRPPKPVTSIGQCCNIMESEDVNVRLNCLGGPKNLTFKSATKCSCYHCKKDWAFIVYDSNCCFNSLFFVFFYSYIELENISTSVFKNPMWFFICINHNQPTHMALLWVYT